MDPERILVVPRAALFAAQRLQGLATDPAAIAHYLAAVARHGRWVERPSAEEDEGLKQVVPYGVVLHGEQVYLFRRGQRGAEPGLRGRWSIGLGGHVNPADGTAIAAALLERALRRELAEEVRLEEPRPDLWAVLNDDGAPVGRRHFGFVYRVWVASPQASSREPGKIAGTFVPWDVARLRRPAMESWSRLALDALGAGEYLPPSGGHLGQRDPALGDSTTRGDADEPIVR